MRTNHVQPVNCDACGGEFSSSELKSVKLAGFATLDICSFCAKKNPVDDYKSAVDILNGIITIASERTSPQERLDLIKALLNEEE